MPDNNPGVRSRHRSGLDARRTTHGGSFDPTARWLPLYGSEMDIEPVTSPDIAGPIAPELIGDGSIGDQQLADLAVTSEKLADNAVELRHMADGSVDYDNILPGAVRTDHLYADAVTSDKIGAGQITADHIWAAGLSALQITSGTLRVGGLTGTSDYIDVFDADGDLIFRISAKGVLAVDPNNADRAMRVRDGIMEFTGNFSVGEDLCTWNTAISFEGVRADSVRVGVAPGGHNLIPNSSFENAPYTVGQDNVWPGEQAWGTAISSGSVNVATGGASLQLTVVT